VKDYVEPEPEPEPEPAPEPEPEPEPEPDDEIPNWFIQFLMTIMDAITGFLSRNKK